MDAKELRIGNYVYAQSGKLVSNRDSIYKVENINLQSAKKYEPIPLTEEWLLKFGFSKHSTNQFWFRKNQICISLVGAIELISWDMQIFKIDTKVNHVHQLQNLYFALTGEELD